MDFYFYHQNFHNTTKEINWRQIFRITGAKRHYNILKVRASETSEHNIYFSNTPLLFLILHLFNIINKESQYTYGRVFFKPQKLEIYECLENLFRRFSKPQIEKIIATEYNTRFEQLKTKEPMCKWIKDLKKNKTERSEANSSGERGEAERLHEPNSFNIMSAIASRAKYIKNYSAAIVQRLPEFLRFSIARTSSFSRTFITSQFPTLM